MSTHEEFTPDWTTSTRRLDLVLAVDMPVDRLPGHAGELTDGVAPTP
jgi:hypothetical protein